MTKAEYLAEHVQHGCEGCFGGVTCTGLEAVLAAERERCAAELRRMVADMENHGAYQRSRNRQDIAGSWECGAAAVRDAIARLETLSP